MRRVLILLAAIFAPSVALAQGGPTYSFANVTPATTNPLTVITAQQDNNGNWVVQVAATCNGAGQMATVINGTASANQCTSNTTFMNAPGGKTSGTVSGTIILPAKPTTQYTMTVTFTFTVQGSGGQATTTTQFKVQ